MEHRLAARVGLGVGREYLVAEAQHFVALGVQLQRLRRVVVGDQQVAAALGQLHHRVVDVERDEPALDGAEAAAQVHHPMREEAERERVRHRELDHVLPGDLVAAHHVASCLQVA